MGGFFSFLQQNPSLLLFFVVGLAVWIGRLNLKGYRLGMVAGAIVVGVAVSVTASLYEVKLELNNFTKLLFYYLFVYGVGLRLGPSLVNSLKGDAVKFTALACVSSCLGLAIVVGGAKFFDLPVGAAGGMLAGSQTMSAAIGSADQAISSGVVKLPPGVTAQDASGMIALSYGITYIWGTVGILLIIKYLPRWWGVDARAAAKAYEAEFRVCDIEWGGLTGYRPFRVRAYRLENPASANQTIAEFRRTHPEYRIVNIVRGDRQMGADASLLLRRGDIVALGGRTEHLTDQIGLLGTEVAHQLALNVPLDQAEILVTREEVVGKPLEAFGASPFAGQVELTRYERGGVPIPAGPKTVVQRFDVICLVGLKGAVKQVVEAFGRVARPNTATDLLTLSVGMILGFLIGMVDFPAFGSRVGLGNAGGLLLSGVIVSSIASRLRFFGNTPNAARNILEDLGLVVFVSIVGLNAGAGLLAQLTGAIALKIFLVGFIACTVPPFVVWAIGYRLFKINAAVLMGGVAGARSQSAPAREAAAEIGSNVPWIGFPAGYAVSVILLTVFGYFAMVLTA